MYVCLYILHILFLSRSPFRPDRDGKGTKTGCGFGDNEYFLAEDFMYVVFYGEGCF